MLNGKRLAGNGGAPLDGQLPRNAAAMRQRRGDGR